MPSGGYRQPARPAAVSNPQSGQRTDGGPGSTKQPLRVPSGGPYGARQAAEAQQQAAPMAAGQPAAPGMGAPGGGPGAPAPQSAFGPTTRPNEAITAGQPSLQEVPDSIAVLRAIYAKYPSPYIAALMGNAD